MTALRSAASSSVRGCTHVPWQTQRKLKLFLLFVLSFTVRSFVIQRASLRPGALCMSSMDYEYIPPNEKSAAPYESDLASVYPPGTPAGLRGEAVRSALRSGRCIAWDLSDSTRLAQGWVGISGKGTRDFLNNKLSQSIEKNDSFIQACLLNPKGRVVDQVCVAVKSPEQAYLLTSPGHAGSELYNRLDPLVFPMDQVELVEYHPCIITLASTRLEHVQEAIRSFVMPLVGVEWDTSSMFVSDELVVLPHAVLPECACCGYTLVLGDSSGLGKRVWEALVGDENPQGPVGIGALEYETLRIEAGLPAYGNELMGGDRAMSSKAPGPLELHWQSYLDLDKGCYLGQEGIASVLKNPRGPPRLLYSVMFDDETNIYDHQSESDKDDGTDNLTVIPQAGQELFVLGSNEKISVGTIMSVAEPGGTGDSTIVGLVLARRADSILKQMKDMDLEVGGSFFRETNPLENDGIIAPPPLDPLDGLEVIVGGTFTVGRLQMVPSRRYQLGQNMFEDVDVFVPSNKEGSVMGVVSSDKQVVADIDIDTAISEEEDLEKAAEEAEKARQEAEAAAAEARRKEEKMKMLKKRAEEAMARRKKMKE